MTRTMKLVLLLSLMVAGTAGATGPSSLEVKLTPLAARKGAVLFRTRYTVNREGAHRFMAVEFGWLVVDAGGGWKEVPHRTVAEPPSPVSAEEDTRAWAELKRADAEFKAPLDWKSPPESLAGLLREYGFTKKDAVARNAGAGTVTWSPKELCQGKRCTTPCRQRTLHEWRSGDVDPVAEPQKPIQALFVHSGLAVFHNKYNDENNQGAFFTEPVKEKEEEDRDPGIEMHDVMAICVLPR
ncbi:hypothetical protein [Archangium violaceum]|uniref:hypothetical protein n=1 Tax=Archangium violaceum TaxID=83451 RepID=UPI0036D9A46C